MRCGASSSPAGRRRGRGRAPGASAAAPAAAGRGPCCRPAPARGRAAAGPGSTGPLCAAERVKSRHPAESGLPNAGLARSGHIESDTVMTCGHLVVQLGGEPHLGGRAPPPAGRRSTAAGRGSSSAAGWHAGSCAAGWGSRSAPPAWRQRRGRGVSAQGLDMCACSRPLSQPQLRSGLHAVTQHSTAQRGSAGCAPASASAGGTP
jgi:hypothetical protein